MNLCYHFAHHGQQPEWSASGISREAGTGPARLPLRRQAPDYLDEPTNHLDIHSVARLMENLRTAQHQLALLLVSHDNDVIRHADEVYEIENGFAVQLTKIDDAIVPGSLAV